MNASHAKQPAASSPVLPPALSPSSTDSNPSPSTAPLQPPVETHARIRSRLRARTRVHVSPFTLRVFLLRGAREEGRGSKRRRDGVRGDKSSGLFHKCATHHVHGFALSLSLSLFRHLPFLVASQYGPVVQCLLRTLMALTREHCVNSG